MQKQIEISELLAKGYIDFINKNITLLQIIEYLGIPEEIKTNPWGNRKTLIYGPLEFYSLADSNLLDNFIIWFDAEDNRNREIRLQYSPHFLEDYDFFKNIEIEELLQYLEDSGQKYFLNTSFTIVEEGHTVYSPIDSKIDVEIEINTAKNKIVSISVGLNRS